jgi:hypothetical protein
MSEIIYSINLKILKIIHLKYYLLYLEVSKLNIEKCRFNYTINIS